MPRILYPAWIAGWLCCCTSPLPERELAWRSTEIIGGGPAESAEFDHTGALVAIDPATLQPLLFCTATLIGTRTVVSAKHCLQRFDQYEARGFEIAWLAGSTPSAPREVIAVAAVESAPANQGGFLDIGQDLAALHLAHPTSIAPALPTLLTSADIGQSMLSVGYGIFTADGRRDDRRRLGHETLVATEGKVFEAMFGSFENFAEWYFTGATTSDDFLSAPHSPEVLLDLELLRSDFDALFLLEGHEAVTGRAPGDTQTCDGDSGGPLARATDGGRWQTYGVLSGGLYSPRSVCDYGSVFSTFGPDSIEFLQAAEQWIDPCGDVSARGECRGSEARRCETKLSAGLRQLIVKDCATLRQRCVASGSSAACEPPPLPVDPPLDGADAGDPPGDAASEALPDAGTPALGG